jgi:D-glycero-D-manno-heptose 1,7-bisphosphate phosphatase
MTAEHAKAVFLDRDGVLVRDRDRVLRPDEFELLPGVPEALGRLARADFTLVVVTNQPVVARGLITEEALAELHAWLAARIVELGGPRLDLVLACPHHPHADVAAYRLACRCRKPGPGLLERAAQALRLDPAQSWLVGDRPSDVAAGRAFGAATVLVETGRHDAAPIVGAEHLEHLGDLARPHHRVADLAAAADLILRGPR